MSDTPAIAVALREAMEAKGITVPDLARDLHWPEATLYGIVGGKRRMIRSRELRDALDDYFGVPKGTTFRIIKSECGSYLNGS